VKINIHLRKKTDEMIDYILLEFRSKYVEMIKLIIPSIIESRSASTKATTAKTRTSSASKRPSVRIKRISLHICTKFSSF
jgi:hypothetical protein